MADKVQVFLDPDGTKGVFPSVIVQAPTGIVYASQCNDYSCDIRKAEGFLVPVGELDDMVGHYLHSLFPTKYLPDKAPEGKFAQIKENVEKIAIWHSTDEGEARHFLVFDEARRDECVEAWIPVLTPYGKGILVYENVD